MGWRHDRLALGSGDGTWHPGKINKSVRTLMKHFLNPYPYDTLTLTKHSKGKCEKTLNSNGIDATFHVQKKNGEICIEMRPLKDAKALSTDCYPYLNCSPLKFHIRKRPEEIKRHRARMMLKERCIEKKCSCTDIKLCRCMSTTRKMLLQDELKRVSMELKMKNEMQFEDVYESSDSEIDFEFSTPSALSAALKCKQDVAHTGTIIFLVIFLIYIFFFIYCCIGTQYDVKHFALSRIKRNKNQEIKNEFPGCQKKFAKRVNQNS
jgi:Domain of unknown function (DUF4776)